jgi:adenylate cyclase
VTRRLLQRYGARWLLGLLLTALAVLQLVQVLPSESLARMDSFIAGLRMRLEAPELDPRIVIVDIDERSLAEVGRFPWSRDKIARLIEQLTGPYEAAAVGFDISFPEPDTSSGYGVLEQLAQGELHAVPGLARALAGLQPQLDYDGRLAAAMRGQPVVLGYSLSGSQRKGVLPAPAFTVDSLNGRALDAYTAQGYEANIARLQEAAQGAGIFTALVDSDGLVRSSALLQRIGDGYYPTLALATVSAALGGRAIAPLWQGTVDTLSAAERQSGGLDAIALFHREGQLRIPVGEALTSTVQFRGRGGPAGGAFRYVPAADVLAGRTKAELLAGTIVLVGTSAPGLNDLRATPVNAEYPGVEIHANLVKSILDDSFKQRPDVATQLEVLQALVLGGVLALALPVLAPAWGILLSLAALTGTVALNFLLYRRYDAVLNMATLLLLATGLFVLNLAWGYFFEVRRGRALVSRFGEYVAPELVAEMAENPAAYSMEGASRELSVMFVDVRGFTTIAESLPPQELREYINRYLTAMSEEIRDRHRGTLDKYVGDAVMAFWGAPLACADHAARAVATALAMQASAVRLSAEFEQRGWPALRIGIGINTGPMHVGDMGSRIRRAYTVMGDAVNLASRLEGITKVYGAGIVVGAATRAAAPGFAWRELDLVRVKGKQEPVAIFEPLGPEDGLEPSARDALQRWHAALALVRAQQWQAARPALLALAAAAPRERLYALYLERIAHYEMQPPGDGWDGVTTFDSK